METVHGARALLGLEVGLILCCVGAAGGCTISVSQPPVLEADDTQGAVTVACSFSIVDCPAGPPSSLWFRFGAHRTETLCVDGCTSEADKFTMRMALAQNQVSLTVNRLTPNDSAIYVCGLAAPSSEDPRAKQAGAGTVLVVRGARGPGTALRGLLAALLALLSVYVVAVLGIFVILTRSKSNTLRNKEKEDSQKKSARRIFQEIAQELYNKRHVRTSQQPEKDNTYENRTALDNYERP
ncbi:immunoglobulin superfamily member 6 isoform X2 [Pipistrellus kuhlii]|uniref:immunoglobulin superfamily member 6 isoform X2 n=1 Tax=Pipistrellus kuhlii TaxID=59472 RepID=UPI00174F712B|nr:immunoglobulin superfamily member 6 isoform X2 [Pipistrellus kuhlii]KAF6294799.1 immunoglobulin superfamily member 6 [Pipistrellus kuhlii]